MASSEDPENRPPSGLGLVWSQQQGWGLWPSKVGLSPGSPEPVTAPLWPRAPHVDVEGCRHPGVWASLVSRVQEAQDALQLCAHPTRSCERSHGDSQVTVGAQGTLGGRGTSPDPLRAAAVAQEPP